MWQPEPGWQRLPGAGPATVGVWAATQEDREVVVKRLARPDAHDPAGLRLPSDVNYWRRAADVALSGVVAHTPGLREAPVVRVEEDAAGVTLVHERVPIGARPGLWLARCLGRFAGVDLGGHPWLARGHLRCRLDLVARREGWTALRHSPVADVAAALWERRMQWLDRCDALPQVAQHGDAAPANLPGRTGDDAIAIDWSHLGTGPVGADLGYLSLTTREALGPLVDAYCAGLPEGLATRGEVVLGARVTAIFTLLTRLDWAWARDMRNEDVRALRHAGLAPYLQALQRQADGIEALLA